VTAIARKFSADGPYTYPVLAAGLTINGGQLVMPDPVNPGGVVPADLGAENCLGVCVADGAAAGVFTSTDAAAFPPYCSVEAQGVFPVTFDAAAVMGQELMCSNNGHVTPYTGSAPSVSLTTALVSGTATTALAVGAIPSALAAGSTVQVQSGENVQAFTLSAAAASGAVSLAVTSQAANFSYPVGSTVLLEGAASGGGVGMQRIGKCFDAAVSAGAVGNARIMVL
jgi:hypothetical protein